MPVLFSDVCVALVNNEHVHPVTSPEYCHHPDGNALAGLIGKMMYLNLDAIEADQLTDKEKRALQAWLNPQLTQNG